MDKDTGESLMILSITENKILLVNRYTCSNLGDQLIAQVFKELLQKHLQFEVIQTDYTSHLSDPLAVNSVLKHRKLKKLIKYFISPQLVWFRNYYRLNKLIKIEKPKLIIVGGGQLLMPGVFCVAAFVWALLAKRNNIKLIFSNIGCGGNFSAFDRFLLRKTFTNADGILFRDMISLKNALGVSDKQNHVKFSASNDIVYTIQKQVDTNQNKDIIGIGLIDFAVYCFHQKKISRNSFYEHMIAYMSLDQLVLNRKVVLFYNTAEDYEESICFQAYYLKTRKILLPIADVKNVEGLINFISSCEKIITARMHAAIIANINSVDVDIIPLSEKLRVLKEQKTLSILKMHETTTQQTLRFLGRFVK